MSGDLANMSLADVFQTLSLSKMEGILKVRTGDITREVAFRDGMVRVLPVSQGEGRRIGHRLLAAGLVSQEQLQTALMAQRKKGGLLGEHLLALGAVDPAKLDALLHSQAEEDLYGLFTWRKGTFVFYKGRNDESQQGGFRFDSNHVLLEVARRSDEWEMILGALGDLDEVFVPTGVRVRKLGQAETAVLAAADGKASVRALSDLTLISLFECARALRVLLEAGAVEPASVAVLLENAESLRVANEPQRAEALLTLLNERRQLESAEQARQLASQWQAQGSSRGAATAMARGAELEENVPERIALLREAVALDGHQLDAAMQLRDLLQEQDSADETAQTELHTLHGRIADALLDLGRMEEALAAADAMVASCPGDLASQLKRAKVLQRMGDPGTAADDLLALADEYKAAGQRELLAQVYEQVIKLDPTRRDVARLLHGMRVSRTVRVRNRAIVTGVAALVGLAGVIGWVRHSAQSQALECLEAASLAMMRGDLDQAEKLAGRIREIGGGDAVQTRADNALAEIQARRKALEEEAAHQHQLEVQRRLDLAADAFENGDWGKGLAGFWEVQRVEGGEAERIRSIVETRLRSLCSWIEERLDKVPARAAETAVKADLAAELKMLQGLFPAGIERRAAELEEALRSPAAAVQGAETVEKLRQLIQPMIDANARAQARIRLLEARISDDRLKDRLNPTFVAARKAEEEFRFGDALEAYRTLADQYRGDTDLHAHFHDMVQRFTFIVKHMTDLQQATEKNAFDAARKELITLRRAHPEIPFGRLVELPLSVDTVPSGARVRIGDRDMGQTPLATRFKPEDRTVVRVEMERHEPAEQVIENAEVGVVRLRLSRRPEWTRELPGPVDQDPVADGHGHVLVSDRSGRLHRVDQRTGDLRWSFTSKEPSGLLFAPVVLGERVYCTSLDKNLFAIGLEDGQEHWRRPLPGAVFASPLLAHRQLVVGTAEGLLLALDPATGQETGRIATELTLRLPPVLASDGIAVTGPDGQVKLFAADLGKELWSVTLQGVARALPAADADLLFVPEGDRRVTALRLRDGSQAWRSDLGEPVRFPLAAAGSELWVATEQRQLRCLDVANGTERRRLELPDVPGCGPVITADRVYLGLRSGETAQFLRTGTGALPRILATKAVRGRPLATPQGLLITVSEDRQVRGFLP